MLKNLIISNYALIENLEIDFPEGLVIITGETGAGKSILMGALSLLLGNKAESDTLINQEKNCVVEALFSYSQDREMVDLLESEGIERTGELILRRVITPAGKSRSFVNDQPVSLQFLKSISGKIIDIHAQHQHLLLGDSRFQLSVLDSYAGNGGVLKEYQEVFSELAERERELATLRKKISEQEEENDYNKFQLEQLKSAKLREGELEELEEEYKILSNAEEIKGTLSLISALLESEELSVLRNLKEAASSSVKISQNFSPAAEYAKRIESCRIELKDIHQEVGLMTEKIIVSPERITLVEERISDIYKLLNKHHLASVSGLIELMDNLEQKINKTGSERDDVERLQRERDLLNKRRGDAADLLHKRREAVLKAFSESVRDSVRELEMPYAEFFAKLSKRETYCETGNTSVSLMFSANREIEPRELGKVASGGELSRIMLCLKAILAKGSGMPTMIFDEIDTGVSGRIADKMGRLINDMAGEMQIFAITHLPQIASKGDCHLLVYKESDKAKGTRTLIKRIEGEERIEEIARMLSGTRTTEAALANAEELLRN